MKTILLVDDEERMLDLLSLYLAPLGYKCIKKTKADEAILFLQKEKADLVILDIMMPEMNGWEACEEIRKFTDLPIIMLTARNEKTDVVKGLKIGADDYISKPFDADELTARIEAVLRRKKKDDHIILFSGLKIDLDSIDVQYEGNQVTLTPKEFSLLSLLIQNRNKVFSREHLITSIWGYDVETEGRTIDSHMRNLRDKLRKNGFPVNNYLSTVWGVGYKWLNEEER